MTTPYCYLQKRIVPLEDAKVNVMTHAFLYGTAVFEGVRGNWVGQGATAFNLLMERWNGDAKKIISALNEFEANLQSSQSDYTAADEAQSASMGRLTSRLG